ncbi:hypothetical protein FRC02_011502 [Tulasnella sp. 418]|nr:hypothetical protein FRC02_011502 [Tulasnella sp. 418]
MQGQLKEAAHVLVQTSYRFTDQAIGVSLTRSSYLKLLEDDAYHQEKLRCLMVLISSKPLDTLFFPDDLHEDYKTKKGLANLQALDEAIPDPFTAMLGTELWEKCSDGLLAEDEDSQQSRATITEKQKADAICDAKERQ